MITEIKSHYWTPIDFEQQLLYKLDRKRRGLPIPEFFPFLVDVWQGEDDLDILEQLTAMERGYTDGRNKRARAASRGRTDKRARPASRKSAAG
jgi:hypothetical protein